MVAKVKSKKNTLYKSGKRMTAIGEGSKEQTVKLDPLA